MEENTSVNAKFPKFFQKIKSIFDNDFKKYFKKGVFQSQKFLYVLKMLKILPKIIVKYT